MNKNGYIKFASYVGSTTLPSGAIPKNPKYPFIVQSSNVQIDEEGHSLYDFIEDYYTNGGNNGGKSSIFATNADGIGTVYAAGLPSLDILTKGYSLVVTLERANAENPSLYVYKLISLDGTQSFLIPIRRVKLDDTSIYYDVSPGFMKANQPYRIVYDGEYWILADFPVTDYSGDDINETEAVRSESIYANGYLVRLTDVSEITEGYQFILIANRDSITQPFICVENGDEIGLHNEAILIRRYGQVEGKTHNVPPGLIEENKSYRLMYDGTFWILVDLPYIEPSGNEIWDNVETVSAYTDNHIDITVTLGIERQISAGHRLIIKPVDWAYIGNNGAGTLSLYISNAINLKEPIAIKRVASRDSNEYFDADIPLNINNLYKLMYDGTYWILVEHPKDYGSGATTPGNISISVKDKVLQLHVRQ